MVSALWAQTRDNVFEKAPPDVDAALRDRIAKFYQAHVDKKPRLAEQYVAEDTKDFFYQANKPVYLSFRIDKITYSDNFTKAKAIVICKQRIAAPGFEAPMEIPTPDTWKLENGAWYWYVDLKAGRDTPFGHQNPPSGATAGELPALSSAPTLDTLAKSVQADKNAVQLNSKQSSSDLVTIANKMPGVVTLRLAGAAPPGLRVRLDRTELKAGEQAKVTFTFEPRENSAPGTTDVAVLVQPTGATIPIRVTIQ